MGGPSLKRRPSKPRFFFFFFFCDLNLMTRGRKQKRQPPFFFSHEAHSNPAPSFSQLVCLFFCFFFFYSFHFFSLLHGTKFSETEHFLPLLLLRLRFSTHQKEFFLFQLFYICFFLFVYYRMYGVYGYRFQLHILNLRILWAGSEEKINS